MIRLLVILAALNAGYFLWNFMETPAYLNDSVQVKDFGSHASLLLVSEVNLEKLKEPEPEPKTRAVVKPCMVSAVANSEVQAKAAQSFLAESGINSKLSIQHLGQGYDYWVLVPVQESFNKAQALSKMLARRGVDNYVVASGVYKNGISIGLFEEERHAHNSLQAFNSAVNGAAEANIVKMKKFQKNYLLLVNKSSAQQAQRLLTKQQRFKYIVFEAEDCR